MTEPDEGYGLVMPFVVCASKGGPYDDNSFVAGWQAGAIDTALAAIAAVQGAGMRSTVYRSLVPQLELIAMKNGFPYATAAPFEEENPDAPLFDLWTVWSCSRHAPEGVADE